jgi:uncharacterized membrane protein YgcG
VNSLGADVVIATAFHWELERSPFMAQRVNVVLVDDIDGTDAVETVSFAIDGVDYEIDLSEKHAADLRDAVSLYIGHARRTGGRRKGRGRSSGAGASGGSAGSGGSGASAADIRAWARENGWEVPERGRVSAEVREAYAAAN